MQIPYCPARSGSPHFRQAAVFRELMAAELRYRHSRYRRGVREKSTCRLKLAFGARGCEYIDAGCSFGTVGSGDTDAKRYMIEGVALDMETLSESSGFHNLIRLSVSASSI